MKALIFDFNRTIYDPDSKRLSYGARQILELAISKKYRLYLVSQRENGREEILVRKDLSKFFTNKFFVAKKDAELLRNIISTNKLEPEELIVIGDNLQSEIRAGYECNLQTIWIKRGKFSRQRKQGVKPTITISDIRQLKNIL